MKLLSSLVLLVSAVAANPVLSARGSNDDPKLFHLKTSGASNQDHDGLYVYGYHTGAGLNDAGLTADLDTAKPAFLNSTNVQFAFDTPFPWGITMRGANNYGCTFLRILLFQTLFSVSSNIVNMVYSKRWN